MPACFFALLRCVSVFVQAAQRLADATYMGTWKTLEEEEQEEAEEEERLRAEALEAAAQLLLAQRNAEHGSALPAI
jgi:hypothetical protein